MVASSHTFSELARIKTVSWESTTVHGWWKFVPTVVCQQFFHLGAEFVISLAGPFQKRSPLLRRPDGSGIVIDLFQF